MLSHGKSAKWLKQFSLWLSVVFEKIKKISSRDCDGYAKPGESSYCSRVSCVSSWFEILEAPNFPNGFHSFFAEKCKRFNDSSSIRLSGSLFCRLLLKFDDGKNLLLGECTSVAAKFHGVFPWHFWHSPFVAIRLLFLPLLFFSFAGMLRPSLCSPCLMLSRLEISTDRRDVRAVDWNLRAF